MGQVSHRREAEAPGARCGAEDESITVAAWRTSMYRSHSAKKSAVAGLPLPAFLVLAKARRTAEAGGSSTHRMVPRERPACQQRCEGPSRPSNGRGTRRRHECQTSRRATPRGFSPNIPCAGSSGPRVEYPSAPRLRTHPRTRRGRARGAGNPRPSTTATPSAPLLPLSRWAGSPTGGEGAGGVRSTPPPPWRRRPSAAPPRPARQRRHRRPDTALPPHPN
jgi:hypothetical protein